MFIAYIYIQRCLTALIMQLDCIFDLSLHTLSTPMSFTVHAPNLKILQSPNRDDDITADTFLDFRMLPSKLQKTFYS